MVSGSGSVVTVHRVDGKLCEQDAEGARAGLESGCVVSAVVRMPV